MKENKNQTSKESKTVMGYTFCSNEDLSRQLNKYSRYVDTLSMLGYLMNKLFK